MYQIIYSIKRACWWVQHRMNPKYKHHIIKLKIEPGYYDPDTKIICSVFQLTEEFIEKTRDVINWSWCSSHETAYKELREAVDFWRDNKRKVLCEEDYSTEYSMYEEQKVRGLCIMHMHNIINHLNKVWYP